jgi:hypothetical protein
MMLKTHMDAVETSLLATSRIPANSGHSLHKGTPRESFIKEFLVGHLPPNVSIGTGEIIDANSKPNEQRNQFDIVVYRDSIPKLDFGGGISGFLIESVVATIEVKSTLDCAGVEQSVKAARAAKLLNPNTRKSFTSGWIPPRLLNMVVAYDGPAQISTVHGWIKQSHEKLRIPLPTWTPHERLQVAGTGLDLVAVLGKGSVKLDNTPLTLNNPNAPHPGFHTLIDSQLGNLLLMFLTLQEATSNVQANFLDTHPYVATARFDRVQTV